MNAQVNDIVSKSVKEMVNTGGLTDEECEEILSATDLETKTKKEVVKKPVAAKTVAGYDKLPKDIGELKEWMDKLFLKREKAKLNDVEDKDKIFNIVTQRFTKRSSCQAKKDCSLKEIVYEGQTLCFTEGGATPKLRDVEAFQHFVSLFTKKPKKKPKSSA